MKSEVKPGSQNSHLALQHIGEEPVMNFRNLAVLLQVCHKLQAKIATKLVFFSMLLTERVYVPFSYSHSCSRSTSPIDHMFYADADAVLRGKGIEVEESFS